MADQKKKRSEVATYICDIRTKGTRDITSAKKLLSVITNKPDWTYNQCQQFYELLLRHYIRDNATIEMLRSVSGLADGYQTIQTASKRREAYLDYLETNNISCQYKAMSVEALKKKEDELLESLAKQLEIDISSGKARQFVETRMAETQDETTTPPSDKTPDSNAANMTFTNISHTDGNHHNTYNIHIQPASMSPEIKNDADGESIVGNSSDPEPIADGHSEPKNNRIKFVVLGLAAVLLIAGGWLWLSSHAAHKGVIDDPTSEITLSPGEIYSIKPVAPANGEAVLVEYISSNPDIVDTSPDGLIAVNGGAEAVGSSVEITIKGSGIYQKKIVNIASGDEDLPPVDLDHLEPNYTVQAKVRLAGTTEWATSVAAELGDEVEFQAKVVNTGDTTLENVMIRDVLPANLAYVPGTTRIYNVKYDGSIVDQDTVTTSGINAGNYGPDSNLFIRFSAKVVDVNLASGSNTLVNWTQAGVGPITLQDYAAVVVQK